jgi:type IV pilus assembly protein PilC
VSAPRPSVEYQPVEADAPHGVDERPFWRRPLSAPRVKLLDVALFASQFRAMIGAGIPINDVLGLLARSSRGTSPRLADALDAIRLDVEEGRTLAYAFRRHEAVFGRLCVEMVATGEATGTLERSLGDVADDCEYRHKNRSSLISAFVEPALIVVLGIGVSYILLTYTVPQFKSLYAALTKDGTLPLPTRLLIEASDVLTSSAGIAAMVGAIAAAIGSWLLLTRVERVKYHAHRLMLRPPLLGDLVLMDAVARACRTLAVVYRSIGDIPLGLGLAAQTTSNLRIAEAFVEVGEDVYDGRMLWEAMRDTEVLPELCVYMTKSGEESGRLDDMLVKLAETFETRVRFQRERFVEVCRYGLLILMGGFVLGLMLAMYLPIFTLIEKMQR